MKISHNKIWKKFIYRPVAWMMICLFSFSQIASSRAYAQSTPMASVLNLPIPGSMVSTSPAFIPPIIKGLTIFPDHPLEFEFIVGRGDDAIQDQALRDEAMKMVKYFLATLTVPEDEMWVNLSPYEKDRIIPEGFGQTEMGRDLLAQDYMLKQLTASLIHPEHDLGEAFWDRVYRRAEERFGSTDIPMKTFNKVWIVPEKAVVLEHGNSAFVVERHLKVMLEEDYGAWQSHAESRATLQEEDLSRGMSSDKELKSLASEGQAKEARDDFNSRHVNQVMREVVIPAIEIEVNQGKSFANLRQIYNAMILAVWYKKNLSESLLGQVYVDQNKTKGVDVEDKQIKQKIYDQYIAAFKKGVYDFIKEDYDPIKQQIIPRKYFSGGAVAVKQLRTITVDQLTAEQINSGEFPDSADDMAMLVRATEIGKDALDQDINNIATEASKGFLRINESTGSDKAVLAEVKIDSINHTIEEAHQKILRLGFQNLEPFALRTVSQQFYKANPDDPWGVNPDYGGQLFTVGVNPKKFFNSKLIESGFLSRGVTEGEREEMGQEFLERLFNTFTSRLNFGDDGVQNAADITKSPVFIVFRGIYLVNENQDGESKMSQVDFSSVERALSLSADPNYKDWYSKTPMNPADVQLKHEAFSTQLTDDEITNIIISTDEYLDTEVKSYLQNNDLIWNERARSDYRAVLLKKYMRFYLYGKFVTWLAKDLENKMSPDAAMIASDAEAQVNYNLNRIRYQVVTTGPQQNILTARYDSDNDALVIDEASQQTMVDRFRAALTNPDTFQENPSTVLWSLRSFIRFMSRTSQLEPGLRAEFRSVHGPIEENFSGLSAQQHQDLMNNVFKLIDKLPDSVLAAALQSSVRSFNRRVVDEEAQYILNDYNIQFQFSVNVEALLSATELDNGVIELTVNLLSFVGNVYSLEIVNHELVRLDAMNWLQGLDLSELEFLQNNAPLVSQIIAMLEVELNYIDLYNELYRYSTEEVQRRSNYKYRLYSKLLRLGVTGYSNLLQRLEAIDDQQQRVREILAIAIEDDSVTDDQLDRYAAQILKFHKLYGVIAQFRNRILSQFRSDNFRSKFLVAQSSAAEQVVDPRYDDYAGLQRMLGDVGTLLLEPSRKISIAAKPGAVRNKDVAPDVSLQKESDHIRVETPSQFEKSLEGLKTVGIAAAFLAGFGIFALHFIGSNDFSPEDGQRGLQEAAQSFDPNTSQKQEKGKGKYEYAPPLEDSPSTPENRKPSEHDSTLESSEKSAVWDSLAGANKGTKAEANGSEIRAMQSRIGKTGEFLVSAEVLEGEEHMRGQMLIAGFYNQILPGGNFINNGVSISDNVPVTEEERVRLRVQIPALKQGDKVSIQSLPGRVARNFLSAVDEKFELVDGLYLRALEDIKESSFVEYDLLKTKNSGDYTITTQSASPTEYEQREFNALNTHPALKDVANLLNAPFTKTSDYLMTIQQIIAERMVYNMYFNTDIEDGTFFGRFGDVLAANELLRCECDLGSAQVYLMLRYRNIPAVYARGWIYKGGQFVKSSIGHAVVLVQTEKGWVVFDSTEPMQSEKTAGYNGQFVDENSRKGVTDGVVKSNQSLGWWAQVGRGFDRVQQWFKEYWQDGMVKTLRDTRNAKGLQSFAQDEDNIESMRVKAVESIANMEAKDPLAEIVQDGEYTIGLQALKHLIELNAFEQLSGIVENDQVSGSLRAEAFVALVEANAVEQIEALVRNPENSKLRFPGLVQRIGAMLERRINFADIARIGLSVLGASFENRDRLLTIVEDTTVLPDIRRGSLGEVDYQLLGQSQGMDSNSSDYRLFVEGLKDVLVNVINEKSNSPIGSLRGAAERRLKEAAATQLLAYSDLDGLSVFEDIKTSIAEMIFESKDDQFMGFILSKLNDVLHGNNKARAVSRRDSQDSQTVDSLVGGVQGLLSKAVPLLTELTMSKTQAPVIYSNGTIQNLSGHMLDSLILLSKREDVAAQEALVSIRDFFRAPQDFRQEVESEADTENSSRIFLSDELFSVPDDWNRRPLSSEESLKIYESILLMLSNNGLVLADIRKGEQDQNDVSQMYNITPADITVVRTGLNPDFTEVQTLLLIGSHDIPYTVDSGDIVGRLAERFYGRANDYPRIIERNGLSEDGEIKFGDELSIPMSASEYSQYQIRQQVASFLQNQQRGVPFSAQTIADSYGISISDVEGILEKTPGLTKIQRQDGESNWIRSSSEDIDPITRDNAILSNFQEGYSLYVESLGKVLRNLQQLRRNSEVWFTFDGLDIARRLKPGFVASAMAHNQLTGDFFIHLHSDEGDNARGFMFRVRQDAQDGEPIFDQFWMEGNRAQGFIDGSNFVDRGFIDQEFADKILIDASETMRTKGEEQGLDLYAQMQDVINGEVEAGFVLGILSDDSVANSVINIFKSAELANVDANGHVRHTVFGSSPEEVVEADFQLIKPDGKDSAALSKDVGGIDLNPALLDLQIKRDGQGVPLPLPQQPIQNMNIDGFLPIIINVSPAVNLPQLLGLDQNNNTLPTESGDQPKQAALLPTKKYMPSLN